MTRGSGKYPQEVSVPMTSQMYQLLDQLAEHDRVTKADILRQALRDYLDVQDGLLGSRSRMGNRVARQLMEIQEGLLKRQARADTLLLAAIILLQMKQGMEGSKVLSQVVQLAAHAGDEIRGVLEAEP